MSENELTTTKRLALDIRNELENASEAERINILDDLYEKWTVNTGHGHTIFDYIRKALANYGITENELQVGIFENAHKIILFKVIYIRHLLLESKVLTDDQRFEHNNKLNQILKAITDANNAISSSLFLMSSMTQVMVYGSVKEELFRYSELNYDELKSYQKLIIYILEKLRDKQFRRYVVDDVGMCYRKKYNPKGRETHAWESAMCIRSFIMDMTRREFSPKMWEYRTEAKDTTSALVKELTECLSTEFYDLEKDRHVFSFMNGVYITKIKNPDFDIDAPSNGSKNSKEWIDKWCPFEGKNKVKLGGSVVSSKYFDKMFVDCSDYILGDEDFTGNQNNTVSIINTNADNVINSDNGSIEVDNSDNSDGYDNSDCDNSNSDCDNNEDQSHPRPQPQLQLHSHSQPDDQSEGGRPVDWFNIIEDHCPSFFSLMEHQRWSRDVKKTLCFMMGRMLYDVGELDDWQVFIFLLGVAGTGKSTIVENILKFFYEPADIGIIGNNAQKQFALSGLVGKKIILGPEIKGDWTIDQAELQSMISGESVSVNTKYKAAASERFTSHLAIAGNIAPQFEDHAGNMARRMILFEFQYKVLKKDTKLKYKIQQELPYIIQACNKGYLCTVFELGGKGLWEMLPIEFKKSQEAMAENSNPLVSFLRSDSVVRGKDHYCREKIFVAALNEYCKNHKLSNVKWSNQYYTSIFTDFDIQTSKNGRRRYPNRNGENIHVGTFFMGVDIIDDSGICDDGVVELVEDDRNNIGFGVGGVYGNG